MFMDDIYIYVYMIPVFDVYIYVYIYIHSCICDMFVDDLPGPMICLLFEIGDVHSYVSRVYLDM